ncbi:SpoIIE family protein phosphatase [Kineococcus rhizosphaerae]|uniref:PAS domain-containing protein n=1 Tax=Kineococcus rhizosphaerae TaxID=559628 RepID=A0A2T0R308_9ACTN|nr:SpoIIE family protein phosphatase [Kineococcus rhizosphaerae]PRY14448.1 PAS domain-containing protein [Kineococcus rhizosphaerae]
MTEVSPYVPAYGEVDLTNCDREPIHVPGAIQPHGFLLAVDRSTRTVVVASETTAAFLGRPAGELLGRPLGEVLGDQLALDVFDVEASEVLSEPLRARLDLLSGAATDVDVVLHLSGDRLVVEVEPVGSSTGVSAVSYRSARAAVSRLSETSTMDELCRRLAHEVRRLTGFDRVMVYRFDAQWNGEVVAEDRREDLNAFLGLHYPASDIPAQARRLYTVNWTRLIADVSYVPSRLHPVLDPVTGAPLDLSFSVLRSVSPIHVEYLRNMGVTASMSISLVQDGQLWGLVACHHYSGPHRPSYDARSAAEFLGQTASQLIAGRQRSDDREDALRSQELLAALVADVSSSGRDPLSSLVADERLLDLVGAGGAALFDGDRVLTVGRVPHRAALQRVATMLARSDGAPTFTDHLASLLPSLSEVEHEAAGALRVGLGADRWLLWVRPEQEEVVDWGGDPHNKELAAAEGPDVRLSPRKSFEKWRETVRGRSLPWERWTADTAERLRNQLTSIVLGRARDQIAIAESLQRAVVLDEAPEFDRLQVLARYRPAEGSQLGGDWWDALDLPDGRVAVVVGDVAGHGVHAAAAMAQLRTALRAYLLEGHSPGHCLDRLDNLVGTLFSDHMATAVIVVLDPDRGTARFASAGHPPPLLVAGGTCEVLRVPPRPLLGVGTGRATDVDVEVPPGGAVLLYSDGLVERRGVALDETIERLRAAAADGPAGDDLASYVDRLMTVVPGAEGDDTTLVLLRRTS